MKQNLEILTKKPDFLKISPYFKQNNINIKLQKTNLINKHNIFRFPVLFKEIVLL